MFNELKKINKKPLPFEFYTAEELWTNEHTSKKMLEYHLNQTIDAASRNHNFIERSVEWIASNFNLDNEKVIADFGCGPGLYTTPLAERGMRVTGIDFSKNSLEYANRTAQKKGLTIKYELINYLDFETAETFDLIIMIMCDYCSLSPEQRTKLLSKFKTMLKKDGSILLDVYSLNYFKQKEESTFYELNQLNSFWSPEDYYCFVNTFKYEKDNLLLDKYTIIEEHRIREVFNWQQCFSKNLLTKEFEQCGLKIDKYLLDVSGKTFDPNSNEFAVIVKNL